MTEQSYFNFAEQQPVTEFSENETKFEQCPVGKSFYIIGVGVSIASIRQMCIRYSRKLNTRFSCKGTEKGIMITRHDEICLYKPNGRAKKGNEILRETMPQLYAVKPEPCKACGKTEPHPVWGCAIYI